MSLLRRNKAEKNSGEQAVPADGAVPAPAEKKTAPRRGGLFGGLRQYLLDSYNGLYKIVLEPSMPSRHTIWMLVLGLIIGLAWGYVLFPTIFYGGNPNRLNQAAQNQWILSAANAYDLGGSRYNQDSVFQLLSQVPDPAGAIATMLADPALSDADRAALQSIQPLAASVTQSAPRIAPADPVSEAATSFIIPLLLVVIVTPIVVLLWRLLIQPNIAAPIVDRFKQATNPAYRAQKQREAEERRRILEQKRLGEELKRQQAAESKGSELGEPVKQSVFIYSKGRNFDESTEIELASGEFLGQCGAVIPDVVAPNPVAAEVWLFDIFGSENKRKIFITEATAANAALRAQIEDDVDNPQQDVVLATPGATIILETGKLRLQSKLAAVTVGPDGKFESFQMVVQAWQKDARRAAAPAPTPAALPTMPLPAAPAAGYGNDLPFAMPPAPAPVAPPPAQRPLSDYDNITFDPPPMPAARPAAPPPPAQRPLSDYDNITFDPPPVAPLRPAAPPPPAQRPLSDYDNITFDPPPMPPARPAAPPAVQPPGFGDDDPFGGTGDFTPLNTGR
ncbi:MAG: hypothetical protein MUE40_00285 [Anaerolineae bacterium]|nr:hypothetical protein [Anaerolineae bacterium]